MNELDIELEKRLTARGLIRYAYDYYQAFLDQFEKYPKDTEMYEIKYYLLFHSIELTFKAYLRHKGYTRKQLMKLGHDIEAIFEEIKKFKFQLDDISKLDTLIGNQYYRQKQFEYPVVGYKELPNLNRVKSIAKLWLFLVDTIINEK